MGRGRVGGRWKRGGGVRGRGNLLHEAKGIDAPGSINRLNSE